MDHISFSGGCSLDIYGENLDSVPYPHLLMYTADRNITSVNQITSTSIQAKRLYFFLLNSTAYGILSARKNKMLKNKNFSCFQGLYSSC